MTMAVANAVQTNSANAIGAEGRTQHIDVRNYSHPTRWSINGLDGSALPRQWMYRRASGVVTETHEKLFQEGRRASEPTPSSVTCHLSAMTQTFDATSMRNCPVLGSRKASSKDLPDSRTFTRKVKTPISIAPYATGKTMYNSKAPLSPSLRPQPRDPKRAPPFSDRTYHLPASQRIFTSAIIHKPDSPKDNDVDSNYEPKSPASSMDSDVVSSADPSQCFSPSLTLSSAPSSVYGSQRHSKNSLRTSGFEIYPLLSCDDTNMSAPQQSKEAAAAAAAAATAPSSFDEYIRESNSSSPVSIYSNTYRVDMLTPQEDDSHVYSDIDAIQSKESMSPLTNRRRKWNTKIPVHSSWLSDCNCVSNKNHLDVSLDAKPLESKVDSVCSPSCGMSSFAPYSPVSESGSSDIEFEHETISWKGVNVGTVTTVTVIEDKAVHDRQNLADDVASGLLSFEIMGVAL